MNLDRVTIAQLDRIEQLVTYLVEELEKEKNKGKPKKEEKKNVV